MTSTIVADLPLATAAHALAELQRRPPDRAALRAALLAADTSLAAFAAALDEPLAEIDGPARAAYLAAFVLRTTLAGMTGDVTALRSTADRILETLEPLVAGQSRVRAVTYETSNPLAPRPITGT